MRLLIRCSLRLLGLAVASLLAACASPGFTVDDGRQLEPKLLAAVQAHVAGEQALRPAIARAAQLRDKDCSRQRELPFAVASSEGWSADERVAWVRVAGVDERVTVVAAAPGSPLPPKARILQVAGSRNAFTAEDVMQDLARARDAGQPFDVITAEGRSVRVVPFELCRGHARFVAPNTPALQEYHWLLSLHPLELAQVQLTPEEALWVVLWSQGLSEEGGVRMKAYDYGTRLVGTLYSLATIASGVKAAAVAADAALKAAQTAAAQAASEIIRQQLLEQARLFAADRMREAMMDAAEKAVRARALDVLQRAAVNRGTLGGLSRVAATVFDRADAWAFSRAQALGADPLAGFTLHQKMVERGIASNAFALDAERLAALAKLAEGRGLGEAAAAVLRGVRPQEVELALLRMPVASTRQRFSYDDLPTQAGAPYARGLVEAMAGMPVASRAGAPR